MKKLSKFVCQISSNAPQCQPMSGVRCFSNKTIPEEVPLKRCLLVSKVTRYEFEQNRHRGASATQLERLIRQRGSDYEALVHYHRLQKDFESSVAAALTELGAEVQPVNRLTYSPSLIDWCDVVIPCGGDGTFLLAASRVTDTRKPVIGLNSDPNRSEGRLCLPKWCSRDIKGAFKAIQQGKFSWLQRSRIRTTLASDERLRSGLEGAPVDLHKPVLPRYNVCQDNQSEGGPGIAPHSYGIEAEEDLARGLERERSERLEEEPLDRNNQPGIFKRVLPYLALNEVFIGENVSARVSHLQVNMDKAARPTRTKSSGLCVCTGTGSTSWYLSINLLRTQSVQELLELWCSPGKAPTRQEARALAEKYNDKLVFPPDAPRLAYSVRELITAEMWPSPKGLRPRGFASNVHVKSRCVDAGLVIDGGMSFPFNDGTEATLETHPEDSLTTITMQSKK